MKLLVESTEQTVLELDTDEYHENCHFRGIDFSSLSIKGHSFEECFFESCKLVNNDLERSGFTDCQFEKCELVLTKLSSTRLNTVSFKSGKIMGLNFSDCSDFGFSLEFIDMIMHSAVFFHKNLRKIKIHSCRLIDCDFGECDMRESDFYQTSFDRVMISQCNLEKADFRSAKGYSIDPVNNKLRNARFTLPEVYSFLGFLGIKIDN